MGSRITRAVYKDERKQPIKKQREEEVKTLVICFLGSINTIYFFLFGYLFRPHIRAPDSLAIFLTILILFLFLQLRQIRKASLITSVALLLTVIITKIIGIDLSLLKAALILITSTLSAVTSFEIANSPFLQTLFLWLAYSSFGLGVKLSLMISKIKLENNQVQALGKEEAFLVQIVFSLVGIMSIFLISFGKRILKIRLSDTQKHTISAKQFVYASLNFILMAFSFRFKLNLQHSFFIDLTMVFSALISFIIINKRSFSDHTWTIICLLGLVSHLINFLTEEQLQAASWISSARILMIDLAIVDSLQRWINWSRNGTHQPILIVFLYFSAFYLSQFSNMGVKTLGYFSLTAMEILALCSYLVLKVLDHFDKASARDYEAVVV